MFRLLILVAACLALAGCASSPSASPVAVNPQGGDEFAALLQSGLSWDFEPTDGPADAASKSDLVVVGTITDIVVGRTLPYGRSNDQANLVVAVEEVLEGRAGDIIYVEIAKPTGVSIAKLDATTPDGRVVLYLDDRTEIEATGPETGRPAGDPIYTPLVDGFVIETQLGWTSGRVPRDDVTAAGWTKLSAFDDVVAASR